MADESSKMAATIIGSNKNHAFDISIAATTSKDLVCHNNILMQVFQTIF